MLLLFFSFKSFQYYLIAGTNGNPDAQYNLGIYYRLGQGVSQNFQESLKWYKLASKQGHSAAQNNLSLLYEEGIALSLIHI